MANVCWFEMRIRGTKENCYEMVNSGIQCSDAYIKAEKGTDADYMIYLCGECRWSVTVSMVDVDEDDTLLAKAQKFNIELEVCGFEEENEVFERFHYKGCEVICENNLPPYLEAWEVEEGSSELSDEDLAKYEKDEENEVYVLKNEFQEHFEYDEEKEEVVFDFSMSFRDLPGYEDGGNEDWDSIDLDNIEFPAIEDCEAEISIIVSLLDKIDEDTLFGILENSFSDFESITDKKSFSKEKFARELMEVYIEDGGLCITGFDGCYRPGDLDMFKNFIEEDLKDII